MAVNPVKYTYTGIPVYRDGDFNLNHRPNAKGVIYTECPLGDHKDRKRRRLAVNLNSGFLRCLDPECCQCGLLESHYDRWKKEHENRYERAFNAKPILDHAIGICSPEVIRYLREERGFTDLSVFDRLGIKEIDHWYGNGGTGDGETARSLCFPFYLGDKILNVQYKRADGKKGFRHGDGIRILYNVNSAVGAETVVITEGPMDCAALVSCGYENTVSIPNGSNSPVDCFDDAEPLLASVREYIFAVDGDKAGRMLKDRLYDKLGSGCDCYYVSFNYRDRRVDESRWFDAKDANECLKKGGVEAVRWCMDHKSEIFNPHVVTADSLAERMDDIFYNGLPEGVTLGLGEFDRYVRFMTRQLYIVTGMPSSGKTNLIDFWITRLAYLHGWKAAVFSPEKDPDAHFMEYIHRIVGKPAEAKHITYEKYTEVRHSLSGRITHLEMDRDNTIDQILATAEEQVRKRGIKVLVIDPFNYIRLDTERVWSESGAINDLLITLKTFAKEHDILIILMAHPKKTMETTDGRKVQLHLYDISGSAAFYNVCDMGIIVTRVRAKKNDPRHSHSYTEVYVEKAREHGRLGDEGTAYLWFSKKAARYAETKITGDPNMGLTVTESDMDYTDWSAVKPEQTEFSFLPEEDDDVAPEDDLPF